jgi:flagellar biogenesis protein FliO
MDEQDEDFWTTYIAATPDEDQDFAGAGSVMTLIVSGILLLLTLVILVGWLFR